MLRQFNFAVVRCVARALLLCPLLSGCFGAPNEVGSEAHRARTFPGAKAAASPASASVRVTVLIALDGVRWQEVFEGVDAARVGRANHTQTPGSGESAQQLMPNLHQLMARNGCAVGAPAGRVPMTASGPQFVSLPGYTEIFTGASPVDCFTNVCGRVRQRTIVDEAARLYGQPEKVAVIASWPEVELAATSDPSQLVVSTGRDTTSHAEVFRRHPATRSAYEAGRIADPSPGTGGFRPDAITAELALQYLEHFTPNFLFLGLGETDEYAHHNDYPSYLKALRAADVVIGKVYQQLLVLESQGVRTVLLVTTDHGRQDEFVEHGAAYPESARTWLVAAGSPILARGEVSSPRGRRLADLAPTLRALWGVAQVPPRATSGAVLSELFANPS